ncbi:MAG: cofactor-independent phosphoglycerate mutase [Dehalococcoidales bacterium]|nr:cofactor-independent phosphoglycerate mutase [Dehalococcoidales bacterium]MDZ4230406.1 cofactor-independent phosphoglycerate mutase [Dehalococcoidales bacterium]
MPTLKYCVLIIDGAAGLPLPERGGKTCFELAQTPSLDVMAREGIVGRARTVPAGMEPSSDAACMSVLGYDPRVYYQGRAAIEATSMGIPVTEGEVVFRCNLVAVGDGKMRDYSAGHISTEEAQSLISALNESLGDDRVRFYPGVSYRHICKLRGYEPALRAQCTPPHDIPGKPVAEFLPRGEGSEILLELMERSREVLRTHPVNIRRQERGEVPATMVWLFWGSGRPPGMPSFRQVYGLEATLTSAVDVLRGLALMMGIGVLEIPGVKDGLDNDFDAQAEGALAALGKYDLAVIHVEAADEAGHAGSIDDKIEAIQRVDKGIARRLRSWRRDALRVLVMPDHPTPVRTQTHSPEPVPFLLWGPGFAPNGALRFTETEAAGRDLFIDPGCSIMGRLVRKGQE